MAFALCTLIWAASLLNLYVQGSSDLTQRFVQVEKDEMLDVKENVTLDKETDFYWKVNGTDNVVKLSHGQVLVFGKYRGRVEFFAHNKSLLLRKLKSNDSGEYFAQISGEKDRKVAEYKVIVQEPVPSVELKIDQTGSDSCNFTVHCNTLDISINKTFRCYNQSCSPEDGEEGVAYGSTLRVYQHQGAIICNHSNQVSWKHDEKKYPNPCEPHPVSNRAIRIAGGTTATTAILVALAVFLVTKWRRKKCQNTEYDICQNDKGSTSLNSTYALVDFSNGPHESTGTRDLETIYAQVNVAGKSKPRPP